MKILRVIQSMDPSSGGPCQGIRNIIPRMKGLGCYNEVVCLDDPAAPFFGNDPFVIHAMGPSKGSWGYSPLLLPWLLKNLLQYDIVIIHGLWQYHGYAVQKAIQQLKSQHFNKLGKECSIPKLYVMSHGMLDPYFQKAQGRKLKAFRNWFYWKLIERKTVNSADGLLFTCEEELQLARKTFTPYKPKRELNVGYGIDAPPPISPQIQNAFYEKCLLANNRPYLLFLSRIHPKKGVDILIKAYVTVLQETSKLNHKFPVLVIAGPGLDTSYGQKMQQMVAENSLLRSNVFFPGMLSGDAKWGAFYGCEAFILPSHQENFGIAIVEALACQKAVLISKQVNICEEINMGGGGIIAEDTFEGTIQLLKSWVSLDPEQKHEMQKRAYNVYKQHFEIAQVADKFQQAISYKP